MPFLQRATGTAFVQVHGKMMALQGGLMVGQSKTERAMVFGQEGLAHGYTETYRAPFVDVELSLPLPGIELEELERQTDVTVIAQFGGDLQYILRNAICTCRLNAQARDNRVNVRWEGAQCIELKPGQPPWPDEVVKDNGETDAGDPFPWPEPSEPEPEPEPETELSEES